MATGTKAGGVPATARSWMVFSLLGDSSRVPPSWRSGHDFCGFGDQLGPIPCCLELFGNRKFSLEKGKKNSYLNPGFLRKQVGGWFVSRAGQNHFTEPKPYHGDGSVPHTGLQSHASVLWLAACITVKAGTYKEPDILLGTWVYVISVRRAAYC